jgi:hypothetical protein
MSITQRDERHAMSRDCGRFNATRSRKELAMSKGTKKASKKNQAATKVEVVEETQPAVNANAIEVLKNVGQQQQGGKKELTAEQRAKDVQKLLHELYNNESLGSKDKKTIRRTLRDTYDYYISRERKNAGSAVVSRILQEQGAA